ncbi:hypothetical protein C0966_04470 [Bacillus methanolicus]|uniref:hypothetical protein n=1 Tax=Bacillus methanolicus TaxID=1471 RepID=UPI0023806D41|nr:hypothetical protein [Bacillus methanolicus]MDE3838643.1 hypothetical protein [Bacillus methanolicus]
MEINTKNNNVYIMSLEAADIYSHMTRGSYIKRDYVGMIPYSLELIKLKKEGLRIINSKKHPKKDISNDIINVKFKQKLKSADQLIKEYTQKIEESTDEDYKNKLNNYIEYIKAESEENSENWIEVSNTELRKRLYTEGFTITNADGSKVKYVVYKRSSAKSRTGQCLFIKEELYDTMINWSRMNLPLKENDEIDLAGLLAYESLVTSSIEDIIKIEPESILIVDDVKSSFNEVCNVVSTGEDGYLDSIKKEVEITNELFDGEALLDSCLFKEGQSMMLLRNHMFKAAAFATNLQMFFKEYAKDNGIDYENWYLNNMFGESMKVTDIKMIINPSCLKAFKFSHIIGENKDMWAWWKKVVKEDGSLFGICKHEKPTKRGFLNDKPLQQTSYQMLNSLPANEEDIKKLSKFERNYIMQLKNDDETFIKYIEKEANTVNANKMFVDLYRKNKDIVRTKVFREFRSKTISDYVRYVKRGKVRLIGDYAVMFGNPLEYLYHAVGEKITEPLALKENEIYTTMFDFGKELVAFRNPHTSQSNVLIVKNTYNKQIEKYFKLTPNIVAVNTIKFNLPNILSGSDFDSDTVVLFDNEDLLELAKKCFGHYKVCVNEVKSKPKNYKLNVHDMFEIDNQLSDSQRFIGEVVNVGQLALSLYWDKFHNGMKPNDKKMKELLKKVDVMTILSGICIDLAKKFYDIDIAKEIKHVRCQLDLKEDDDIAMKPNFWRFVTDKKNKKSNKNKKKYTHYDCPMDYLYDVMSFERMKEKDPINFSDLLIEKNKEKSNRKQRQKIKALVEEMYSDIARIKSNGGEKNEVSNKVEDITNIYLAKIGKLKVKPETMYNTLREIDDESSIAIKLLNVMHRTQHDVFMNAFIEK